MEAAEWRMNFFEEHRNRLPRKARRRYREEDIFTGTDPGTMTEKNQTSSKFYLFFIFRMIVPVRMDYNISKPIKTNSN